VLAGALLLHGCATERVELPPVPTVAGAGHVAAQPGRPGLVVAAPHGSGDLDTEQIAGEIARRTGFGLVVATGLAPEGQDRPARVPEVYERRVREVAQGPLRLYAEIHGDDRWQCAGQIEIATLGIDRELALRLRALAELIRDAHLRGHAEVERLDVRVEPLDVVTRRAWGGRREGIVRSPERALHIALPRCARRDFRDTYTAVLADFLIQAVMLPGGR
jgi:hypothetical protein